MADSLALPSIDLVKRTYFVSQEMGIKRNAIEDLPKEELEHFFRSLCDSIGCTMQLKVEYGTNDHHKVEAVFKALALSLRRAAERDSRRELSVPSSKGSM